MFNKVVIGDARISKSIVNSEWAILPAVALAKAGGNKQQAMNKYSIFNIKYSIGPVFIASFLIGCSGTRHLPEGERLYTGARVAVEGPSLTVKEKKVLRKDLQGLTRPKPN